MELTADLVRRLIATQFPRWSELSIAPVAEQGHDNRTFRLGEELAVRLPSHDNYVAGITKEDAFLPLLARHLTIPVPSPVASGQPSHEYPYPWSVRHWLPGETSDAHSALDRMRFAHDLGTFLRELRGVPADDGPAAGRHSFYRGCHPSVYGDQVQAALTQLGNRVDGNACRFIWHNALLSAWDGEPVWFHGDIATGNLLAAHGRLAAVIDFGTCGVGDPACDLVIAWTFLKGNERTVFREAVGLPYNAWTRARGWAIWKALITVTEPNHSQFETQARALSEVLADFVNG